MTEGKPRPQEREWFAIPGEHVVGGGDVPTTGLGCLELPEGMRQRSCPGPRKPVVVDCAGYLPCRLIFKWSMNDYT
jgi:hypothetical protein